MKRCSKGSRSKIIIYAEIRNRSIPWMWLDSHPKNPEYLWIPTNQHTYMDTRIPMESIKLQVTFIHDTNLDTYLQHERCVFVRNPGDEPKLPKVAVKVQRSCRDFWGQSESRGISKMIRRVPLRRGIHDIVSKLQVRGRWRETCFFKIEVIEWLKIVAPSHSQ